MGGVAARAKKNEWHEKARRESHFFSSLHHWPDSFLLCSSSRACARDSKVSLLEVVLFISQRTKGVCFPAQGLCGNEIFKMFIARICGFTILTCLVTTLSMLTLAVLLKKTRKGKTLNFSQYVTSINLRSHR